MKYQTSSKIKLGLLGLAIIIGSLIFWINQEMVSQLRLDAQKQVEYLAEAYAQAINSSDENELRFVLDVILPSLNFPIVITTNNEIYATINLDIPYDYDSAEYKEAVWLIVSRMDNEFEPMKIVWEGMEVGDIHYGDHEIINRIRWLPAMELFLILLFILLSLWGIQLIRNSERNSIYVGMARETAHQLGTPISSLLGWIKLLQEDEIDKTEIVNSINIDLSRLSSISDRFAKIGSIPKKEKIEIKLLIKSVCDYLSPRLSKHSKVNIKLHDFNSEQVLGDNILLFWAFENLIKNSIDAIGHGEGEIILKQIKSSGKKTLIDIIDSGRGIPRKDKKNVFKPGFSSKKRGWGLGLSLTKRIINELHNGKVYVLQSQPGNTVIRVELHLI